MVLFWRKDVILMDLKELIGGEKIEIACGGCGKSFKVKLASVMKDGTCINCPSCRASIKVDHDSRTKKTLRDAEKALKDLEKMFK